jgi:hypothetical protein
MVIVAHSSKTLNFQSFVDGILSHLMAEVGPTPGMFRDIFKSQINPKMKQLLAKETKSNLTVDSCLQVMHQH